MIRRTALLFCSAALFLLAADAEAGARRITPMDRFSDAICEASPEAVALDPVKKALRELAAALSASKLPNATLTLDGGAGTLSIYCRQPCLGNCLARSEEAGDNCQRQCPYCSGLKPPEHPCHYANQVCVDQCISDQAARDGLCYDTCCFDY